MSSSSSAASSRRRRRANGTSAASRGRRECRATSGRNAPKGDPGAASARYTIAGHEFLNSANYKTVVTLDLPGGKFLLTGKGQANNEQETSDVVSCNVDDSATATSARPPLLCHAPR